MVADIVTRVVFEAVLGPTLSSMISKFVTREQQRRKCAVYYTMLIRAPDVFRDEVARMGEVEGCWSSSFVKSLLSAEKLRGFGVEDDGVTVSPDRVKSILSKVIEESLPLKR